MESLLYSLNVTVPVFAMIALGYLLRRTGTINMDYVHGSNRLTFRVLLPVMLFNSMRNSDFQTVFDLHFALLCFLFLLIFPIAVLLIASRFIKDRKKLGSFVQGTFRGNSAVIGVSVAQNIYGADLGLIPLMLGVAMFMYNTVSTVLLTICGGEKLEPRQQVKNVVKNLLHNQIIWGVFLGLVCGLFRIRFPLIIDKIFNSIGGVASVVSLIAAGGGFTMESFRSNIGLIFSASAVKLIVMPAASLTVGYLAGLRGSSLFALLVMGGVSTATTSAVMARELKCDEELAINILAVTTLLAAFTLTMWVYLLSSLGLL